MRKYHCKFSCKYSSQKQKAKNLPFLGIKEKGGRGVLKTTG
jgi:hypothetical protein